MSVESRDYPDVHDVEDKSTGRRQKEFDDLLELAERLQEDCDRVEQRVSLYRLSQVAIVLSVAIVVWLYAATMGSPLTNALAYAMIIFTLGGLYTAGIAHIQVRKLVVRRGRDRSRLSEVVELLRSTERSVAKDEGLSVLERARLRIQLSRFDI